MKTLAILGAIAAVALATASAAAPSASQTLRGTVVAKDRAHHALVVASSARVVKAVVTQRTFSLTPVGRTLTIRFTTRHHALPVALSVTPHDEVGELEVRGTVTTLTATAITVSPNGTPVTCAIPAGASVTIPGGRSSS